MLRNEEMSVYCKGFDTYGPWKLIGGINKNRPNYEQGESDNMKVIIYGSQYGTTKKYAEELGRRTNIEVKNYEDIEDINLYDTIIYFGALYAGGIDYSCLGLKHKTMMAMLYKKAVGLSEEKKTAEVKAMIETYNKKVDFIDYSRLNDVISLI